MRTKQLIFPLLLSVLFSAVCFAQAPLALVNASERFSAGVSLTPCMQVALYGPIVNTPSTYAPNSTTNLLAGHRVRLTIPGVSRLATISYIGNGQANFIMPCDRILANNNVTVELEKQQPNSSFLVIGRTNVSLEEYAPGLFMQQGDVPAGTFFQRERGIDAYLPMAAILPDGKPGPVEYFLNPGILQVAVLYTTGGRYIPNPDYVPELLFNGKRGLGATMFYGQSSFAESVDQLNVLLNAQAIIEAGFAFKQFIRVDAVVNGKFIGTGYMRFSFSR